MSKSFYKALYKSMGYQRQAAMYWKRKGIPNKPLIWLSENADCSEHEGQFFLTFSGEDHPITEVLHAEIKHRKNMEQIRKKTL